MISMNKATTVSVSRENHKRISLLKMLLDASTFEEAIEHAIFKLAQENLEFQKILKLHNAFW